MKSTQSPAQFNFAEHWYFKILPLRSKGLIGAAFRQLQATYEEIAQWEADQVDASFMEVPHLAELFEKKFELEFHIARVKCFDLYWIQETFESDQMVPLSLAIAQEFYPEKKWVVIGEGTEEAIVADKKRTLVFDLKNFRRLSGAASLALAGETDYQTDKTGIAEALHSREEKLRKELESLQSLQNLVSTDAESRKLSLVAKDLSKDTK